MNRYLTQRFVLSALFIIAIILAGIQFLSDRGVWLDEAVLTLNLIHRNAVGLFRPLDYNGVAPVLFLLIQKAFISLVPRSDYALKVFPLICYLAFLPLFARILSRLFKSIYSIILGLSLVVFNQTIIYYSSEAKQYIVDLLVITIFYYLLIEEKALKGFYYKLLVLGLICIYLSNITPIILLTVDVYLFYKSRSENRPLGRHFIITNLCWGVFFALYYFVFIYSHPTQHKMVGYWSNAGAFMPLDSSFWGWMAGRFHGIFYFLFYFGQLIGSCIMALFGLGVILLVRYRRYDLMILTLLPVCVHLVLSGFKLYPFETRLYLYLTPGLVITCVFSCEFLVTGLSHLRFGKVIGFIFLLLPALMARVVFIHQPPYTQHDDIKRGIETINKKFEKGDALYTGNLTGLPVKYYKDLGIINEGLDVIYRDGLLNTHPPYAVKRLWVLTYSVEDQPRKLSELLKSRQLIKKDSFETRGGVRFSLFAQDNALVQKK